MIWKVVEELTSQFCKYVSFGAAKEATVVFLYEMGLTFPSTQDNDILRKA